MPVEDLHGRGQPNTYLITLPAEVSDYDIGRLTFELQQRRSLGASVAQVIIQEATRLMREEWPACEKFLEEYPERLFNNPFFSWQGYTRPSHALLNAEELLRRGITHQSPMDDEDFSLRAFGWQLTGDMLKKWGYQLDTEAHITTDAVEWFLRENQLLKVLKTNGNPLEFVDEVVRLESANLHPGSGEDRKRKDALVIGRNRFHQLYKVGKNIYSKE